MRLPKRLPQLSLLGRGAARVALACLQLPAIVVDASQGAARLSSAASGARLCIRLLPVLGRGSIVARGIPRISILWRQDTGELTRPGLLIIATLGCARVRSGRGERRSGRSYHHHGPHKGCRNQQTNALNHAISFPYHIHPTV